MAESYGLVSLLPPVLTITLALRSKRVLPSLMAGVLLSHLILSWPHPLTFLFAAIDQIVAIATDPGNFKLIAFSLMVGGLLQLIRDGRGFEAFANAVSNWRGGAGKAATFGLTTIIGTGLFLDVWSNVLVNGATVGSLFDRLGLSRVRLAYIIHTLGICVVAMATLNGWGAFYMGLLNAQNVAQPLAFIVASIPFMIYCWISLALVFIVMLTGLTLGPMRRFDDEAAARPPGMDAQGARLAAVGDGPTPRMIYMLLPLATLLATVFVALSITGNGDMLAGDSSLAILYGVALASAVAALLLLGFGAMGPVAIEESFVGGMSRFFDVGILIVLALAIGALSKQLGTGVYISQLAAGTLPAFVMPAIVFLLGAVMSFATGTSYGTFSIMLPIALPIAASTGIDPHVMFGAVISGGLFGDNTSPISDTTIMTTIGAEVKVVDHVATQLPYALVSGSLAAIGFLILGLWR